MKNLFVKRKWNDLIPDQDHSVVIAGYGQLAEYIGRLIAENAGNLRPGFVAWLRRFTSIRLSEHETHMLPPPARA